eukprot:1388404-Rhodomonas_salina.2
MASSPRNSYAIWSAGRGESDRCTPAGPRVPGMAYPGRVLGDGYRGAVPGSFRAPQVPGYTSTHGV